MYHYNSIQNLFYVVGRRQLTPGVFSPIHGRAHLAPCRRKKGGRRERGGERRRGVVQSVSLGRIMEDWFVVVGRRRTLLYFG